MKKFLLALLELAAYWLFMFCEYAHLDLGRLAPYVFGVAMGCYKFKRVKSKEEEK